MKKLALLFIAILITGFSFGQKREKVKGSKNVTIEKKEIGNFENLEIEDNIDILLIKSDKCSIEIEADVILKGTRVDGIYTADPEKDKNAVKYDTITFEEVYEKGLNVMDMTAFTLCKENKLPIIVFDMNKKGNLKKLVNGEKLGTLVEMR